MGLFNKKNKNVYSAYVSIGKARAIPIMHNKELMLNVSKKKAVTAARKVRSLGKVSFITKNGIITRANLGIVKKMKGVKSMAKIIVKSYLKKVKGKKKKVRVKGYTRKK